MAVPARMIPNALRLGFSEYGASGARGHGATNRRFVDTLAATHDRFSARSQLPGFDRYALRGHPGLAL